MACTFQATLMWEIHTTHYSLRDEDMNVITMIATYNTAVTDAASEIHVYLGMNVTGKCHRSPGMFSTSLMRGDEMV